MTTPTGPVLHPLLKNRFRLTFPDNPMGNRLTNQCTNFTYDVADGNKSFTVSFIVPRLTDKDQPEFESAMKNISEIVLDYNDPEGVEGYKHFSTLKNCAVTSCKSQYDYAVNEAVTTQVTGTYSYAEAANGQFI